ncbi:MAG: hypothetical protein ACRBEQ_07355, partial [Hyphomonas sp.]
TLRVADHQSMLASTSKRLVEYLAPSPLDMGHLLAVGLLRLREGEAHNERLIGPGVIVLPEPQILTAEWA